MPACYFCGKEIEIKGKVLRKDCCPFCGKDLHSCVQCRFYDEGKANRCREPAAEEVREREKANQCGYFEFSGRKSLMYASKEDVKKKLDELFKK